MPQLNGGGGDDLGANDELISFKDEGEQEEKIAENVSERDLDDVKSSLVNESENNSSSSDSEQTDRRPQPRVEGSYAKQKEYFAEALRRQQDGGFFKSTPYAGYPFLMIPDLTNPYLSNGSLSPGARTSNKVPVVQPPPHMHPLTPLITYSNERFSPRTPPSHLSPDILDPKTGIPRTPHPSELSPYYPLSPGAVGQITHPLGWLVPQQNQHVYSIPAGGFRTPYAALTMSPSMSSLVSGHFSPHMAPSPALRQAGIVHPVLPSPSIKQETSNDDSDSAHVDAAVPLKKVEEQKPHIKKPLNAFMLYMKEMRAKVVSECTLKESAAINQILGRRWHSLSREEQAKYYELARKERQLHSQLYPGWSARDNYGKRKKRKRDSKSDSKADDAFPPQSKQPCVVYLSSVESACHSPASSHGSMLDSPDTPSVALASPAAPAATHTEQAQPLPLTTKPESRAQHSRFAPPSKAGSSSSQSCSLLHRQSPGPRPLPRPPLLSGPLFNHMMMSSQHALQTQPLSLVTKPND